LVLPRDLLSSPSPGGPEGEGEARRGSAHGKSVRISDSHFKQR
jgi:hypothetical protein